MNNHSLLIADDEANVRALLRGCVDWAAIGIEIVAEAGNAAEALESVDRLAPEIVCLDICMPITNGIELAREIRYSRPATEIVVISGYDNFSYAQECIRIGVVDYILKPIEEDYLKKVMLGVVARIEGKSPSSADIPDQAEPAVFDADAARHSGSAVLREILEFTKAHFADPDLSLQSLAGKFYLNPSYISRAFKQETGENWVDCLTRIRMDRARELAVSSDLLCYEIAQQVGFSDAKYFSASFKNFTGVTLNDYRKGKKNTK